MASVVSAETNTPTPASAAAPVVAPKPWKLTLTPGSRKALLDGVTVWLSEAVTLDSAKQPRAAYVDRRTTLEPILHAPTNALVNGRAFRVMVDPGHGGTDPGALSRDGKHRESVHAMDIARRLSTYLTHAGYDVRITRRDDKTFIPLEDRPAMAAAWRADVLVSIHLNAAPDAAAQGLETFVMPPPGVRATSQLDLPTLSANGLATVRRTYPGNACNTNNLRLAFCIQRRLLKTTGYVDRGLRRARFTVLRDAEVPAVLVEAGFLSNREDLAFLATPSGRERIARGLYQGIVDYAQGHVAPGFPAPPVVPATSTPAKLVNP
jgi:N-acetylmuramoyl-L-alanine amidase